MDIPDLPAGLSIHRLADRPELIEGVRVLGGQVWPRFMMQSSAGGSFYVHMATRWADCALVVTDPTGDVVCRCLFVPFPSSAGLDDRGWDWVIETGIAARESGTACDVASALEIGIRPDLRGGGLSGILLAHMRTTVAAMGMRDLYAPVRPSAKHEVPEESMAAYLLRVRDDGLPEDPWLRVHVRAGGEVIGPCEQSMHIEGSVGDWREWTGLDLSEPGPHIVPLALAPVVSDGERVVYVEPNVWVRHRLG